MTDIVVVDAVSGTTITAAAYNGNLTAITDVVNGGLTDGNIDDAAAISATKLSGVAVVRGPFAFAFNTASINAGVTVYTPVVGDILLDAWFEITTAFDGTTPKADIGSFSGTTSGLFDISGNAVPLGTADTTATGGAGISINVTSGTLSLLAQVGSSLKRTVPSRFTTTAPLKLVVSQTGLAGGTAIGGAAGAGKLYIVTATPVAL